MKTITATLALILAVTYLCYGQHISKSNVAQLTIDSSLKAGKGAFYYRLLFKLNDITYEVYKVKNRDYSVDFTKKFHYKSLNYICYEIYDLPTGVTWNLFYNTKSNQFYITNHYDMHAMGDKLIKNSVSFEKKIAKGMAFNSNKPYVIHLSKLAPKQLTYSE